MRLGEEVLAFAVGGVAVGYGAAGAYVVAAQAEGTVVAPSGSVALHCDVVHRAAARAGGATGAAFGAVEWLGRHCVADEPGVDDARLYPRKASSHRHIGTSLFYSPGNFLYACRGLFYLPCSDFGRVDIEAFHQHVGIGHYHGIGAGWAPAAGFDASAPLVVG